MRIAIWFIGRNSPWLHLRPDGCRTSNAGDDKIQTTLSSQKADLPDCSYCVTNGNSEGFLRC
jgi:hypothetical protein